MTPDAVRPAGGGQHSHHPPPDRRHAQTICRLPPGGGALRNRVLGTTGVESAEAVRGWWTGSIRRLVIAVDALASRRVGRLCCTVQFSDTGIIPGSGVGNHRSALNRETLGVPVLAVGVPPWWTPPRWRRICWRNPACRISARAALKSMVTQGTDPGAGW